MSCMRAARLGNYVVRQTNYAAAKRCINASRQGASAEKYFKFVPQSMLDESAVSEGLLYHDFAC